ncbi:MAG: fused MFS/spermidine synthase [Deltaproteobacteria bacterium]|nr:fused MFS/spermidine synthase [Deltaproteobacteria bacterium]
MLLYAATIFLSSFLLFLIQPILAKQILPWFGGAAAVWTTCLVFFQFALLIGYAYSDWTARRLGPKAQAALHALLLGASLWFLPVLANPAWKPLGAEDPALRILGLLAATVGLPYFLLSTTGPLIQAWFARTLPDRSPYRLFALSNLASMLGLLAYPFVVEPRVSALGQSHGWSAAYALFVLLCAASALRGQRGSGAARLALGTDLASRAEPPTAAERVRWFGLAALGSFLLLAVTNHLCLNIASIPFLWILPLSLYLLSFILCFDGRGWYRRGAFLPLSGVLLAAMSLCLANSKLSLNLQVVIPVYLAGLFALLMVCHGELAERKPAPAHLTAFYLMISLGGAIGALVVGVLAPYALPGYFELGFGLVAAALLLATIRHRGVPVALARVALMGFVVVCSGIQFRAYASANRVMARNFYGSLRTSDTFTPGGTPIRQFVHGAIRHGEQYLRPDKRDEPTSYYSPSSGIGRALRTLQKPGLRVGVVGLGAGAIAVWAQPGQYYRFYEINPQVVEVARSEFSFLADCRAGHHVVLGDARLQLEREPPQGFDLLVLDAFSGDAIPTHLITSEAFAVYLRHMNPGGVLAFNTTNRYLDAAPVVKVLAESRGLKTAYIHDAPEDAAAGHCRTDWLLVSANHSFLGSPLIRSVAGAVAEPRVRQLWTDDFTNLFHILK